MTDTVQSSHYTDKAPWLSIIIPIYNAEKHLCECIDSILGQSFKNFELLLVDDGSTDASPKICTAYANSDKRVRYIRKENEGSFVTRIHGATLAKGEYITFCDSDDYYATRKAFEFIYHETVEHDYSLIQFCFAEKFNHLTQKKRIVDKKAVVYREEFQKNQYSSLFRNHQDGDHLTPNVWNKFYKRNLFDSLSQIVEKKRIFWGDDVILNLYLLQNCESALFLPDSLYVYRQSGGTKTFSVNTMRDLNLIKQYQLEFLEKRTYKDTDVIKNALFSEVAAWFYLYVREALHNIDEDQTKAMIIDSLSLPYFQLTREHFLNNSENWTAVNLLRSADPDKYIAQARIDNNNNISTKTKISNFIKNIYKKI